MSTPRLTVRFKMLYWPEGSGFTIRYQAEADRAAPCSLTNHSYFSLNGHGFCSVMAQQITLYASHYTPNRSNFPDAILRPVQQCDHTTRFSFSAK